MEDYPKALFYYNKILSMYEKVNDKNGISQALLSFGNIYHKQKKEDEAIKYYEKSLAIQRQIGVTYYRSSTLNFLSIIMFHKGDNKKAIAYGEQAVSIAKTTGKPIDIKQASENMQIIYAHNKNWKGAYEMSSLARIMSDSINNVTAKKAAIKKELQFEYEKKVATDSIKIAEEKKIEQVKLVASQLQLKQEKNQRLALYGGLALVLIFSGFTYKRFKVSQKQKHIIEVKEKETTFQKHVIEEKHKEITDSINYAERIQRSFIATEELLNINLHNYFVLFKPKDVVSGDFYWGSRIGKNFALVTADSTGHGVPGAIMSLLNVTSLEKAIEYHTDPAEILNATRKTIIERLKKDGSEDGGKDGMDCSLIVFDFENKILKIAAANNPVWILRQAQDAAKELLEIKPDKMPVGKHDKDQQPFTTQTIQLQKGDVIYTLTDGFPDQFGGENGKRFMSKRLKELLIANSHLPMSEQKELLDTTFKNWAGNLEQVDDVTVIGIRV
jgi:serine phosphatase RsbU (regulator of sigma subunit)